MRWHHIKIYRCITLRHNNLYNIIIVVTNYTVYYIPTISYLQTIIVIDILVNL